MAADRRDPHQQHLAQVEDYRRTVFEDSQHHHLGAGLNPHRYTEKRQPSPPVHTNYTVLSNDYQYSEVRGGAGTRHLHSHYGGHQIANQSQDFTVHSATSRSPPRSILAYDAYERAEMESQAKHEYDLRMDALRHNLNEDDVHDYEKAEIIKKSVDKIFERATYQNSIRRSPERYDHVKSKVARCLKVQKSVNRRSRKQREEQRSPSPEPLRHRPTSPAKYYVEQQQTPSFVSNRETQVSPFRKAVQDESFNDRQHNFLASQPREESPQQAQEYEESINIQVEETRQGRNRVVSEQVAVPTYESQFSHAPGPIVKRQQQQRPVQSAQKERPPTSPSKQPRFIKKAMESERKPIITNEEIWAKQSPVKKAKKKKSTLHKSSSTAKNIGYVYIDMRSRSPGPRYVKVPLAESAVSPGKSPITVGPSQRAQKVSQHTEPRKAYRSPGKYRNVELEKKTNLIQQEYDNLLNEMLQIRQQQSVRGDDDGFYWVMNDYIREYCGSRTGVAPPSLRKHASPTKRLISLKNTTFSHKKVMHENMQQVRDHSSYQLTYSTSPGKTYVIEPHGGELNYKLVDRHPERFYHQVFNQDITQTKFRESPRRHVEISTKVTKRPYMKIMEKIRTKIADRLKEKFGDAAGEAILEALREKHIEHQIVLLLRQDKIQLLNQHNEPIYVKQIQHAIDHHTAIQRGTAHLLQAPHDVTYDGGSDAEGQSAYGGASRSKLEMQERDLQSIEGEVREHLIRQASIKQE